MKKIIKPDENISFPDKIIGISSYFPDFKIVWSINNLGFKFSKLQDINKNFDGNLVNFSVFEYADAAGFRHYLISNKNKGYVLMKKYGNFDYIFLSDVPEEKLESINKKLSETKAVMGSYLIVSDKNTLKLFADFLNF